MGSTLSSPARPENFLPAATSRCSATPSSGAPCIHSWSAAWYGTYAGAHERDWDTGHLRGQHLFDRQCHDAMAVVVDLKLREFHRFSARHATCLNRGRPSSARYRKGIAWLAAVLKTYSGWPWNGSCNGLCLLKLLISIRWPRGLSNPSSTSFEGHFPAALSSSHSSLRRASRGHEASGRG